MINERAKAILEFCFINTPLEQWFKKDDEFDNILRSTFMDDYTKAINNGYDNWKNNAEECVALIILLDQLSRNFFRNNSKAYDQDTKCVLIVKEAINKRYLDSLDIDKIHFLSSMLCLKFSISFLVTYNFSKLSNDFKPFAILLPRFPYPKIDIFIFLF